MDQLPVSNRPPSTSSEQPQPAKRMRIDSLTGPSAYNLYCRDISQEAGVKAIPRKQKFKEFAARWSALGEEEREEYFDKAAAYNLSEEEKDRQWRANFRKMMRLINYQKELKPSTEGFVVLSNTPGVEYCYGTDAGKKYLEEHSQFVREFVSSPALWAPQQETKPTISQIRGLFNSLYAAALGVDKAKMPYKCLESINVTGLPDGLVIRDPARYGSTQLKRIWEVKDQISVTVAEPETETEH